MSTYDWQTKRESWSQLKGFVILEKKYHTNGIGKRAAKKRQFQYFYTHTFEEALPAKSKGTKSNPSLWTPSMLTASQNHGKAGTSNTSLCSLICKDIRPALRAAHRNQYIPTHPQCPICNKHHLSESRNNLSLLNLPDTTGTWSMACDSYLLKTGNWSMCD